MVREVGLPAILHAMIPAAGSPINHQSVAPCIIIIIIIIIVNNNNKNNSSRSGIIILQSGVGYPYEAHLLHAPAVELVHESVLVVLLPVDPLEGLRTEEELVRI